MESMLSRESVVTSLNHQEPDRVPIDFGGTTASTIVVAAYENLKKHLGFKHENKLRATRASTVIPDDSILEHFRIDTSPLLIGDFSKSARRTMDSYSAECIRHCRFYD